MVPDSVLPTMDPNRNNVTRPVTHWTEQGRRQSLTRVKILGAQNQDRVCTDLSSLFLKIPNPVSVQFWFDEKLALYEREPIPHKLIELREGQQYADRVGVNIPVRTRRRCDQTLGRSPTRTEHDQGGKKEGCWTQKQHIPMRHFRVGTQRQRTGRQTGPVNSYTRSQRAFAQSLGLGPTRWQLRKSPRDNPEGFLCCAKSQRVRPSERSPRQAPSGPAQLRIRPTVPLPRF